MTNTCSFPVAPTPAGPLAGLKVIELGQLIAGPFAARTLADFGAEVIKIEPPGGEISRQVSDSYFASLNGHAPGHLYDLVMREVEEPLFRAVLDYAEGNQSRAADILGINRGTLRKKLKVYKIEG